MKHFATDKIRNVALVGHGGSGKTTMGEAMLYATGATSRLGSVDEGNSLLDYDAEEIRRKISINTSVGAVEWLDHKLNILDTPGYFDFIGEVKAALRVADGAAIVMDASAGLQVGVEKAWNFCEEDNIPRMIFINKMDRENADFEKCLNSLRGAFGNKITPVSIPIGAAESFEGVVDLVQMKAFRYNNKGQAEEIDIPESMSDAVEEARSVMLEAVSVSDEEVMMKYLEGEEITTEDIEKCLGLGTASGEVVPVMVGSGKKLAGIDLFLGYCVHCLPSPASATTKATTEDGDEVEIHADPSEPLCALVFKTISDPYVGKLSVFRVYSGEISSDSSVYNVSKGQDERIGQLFLIKGKEQQPVDKVVAGDLAGVAKLQHTATGDTLVDRSRPVKLEPIDFPQPSLSLAVQPKTRGDEEKISGGLARLTEEDPTFTVERNTETGQTIISGVGEMHLEVITTRLRSKFGVDVDLSEPKVPYRETIRKTVETEGRYKKQTGGRGQYGHVFLRLEPLEDKEFEFVDEIFGGAVPKQYIPAVEKGVRETMAEGVLAGYKVTNVKVTLYDGSYHSVDSSEMAFKTAASMAFKKGFFDANPVLLEPIMKVEVKVPEENMGDIMGDLNKKRGRILGMEPDGNYQVIKAQVPLAEMFRYAIDLRSMTQGRGTFVMEFDHYEQVPPQVQEAVIAEAEAKEE